MSYVCVCSLCIRKYYAIHDLRASDAKNTKLLPLARQNIHETHTHTFDDTVFGLSDTQIETEYQIFGKLKR